MAKGSIKLLLHVIYCWLYLFHYQLLLPVVYKGNNLQ